MNSGAQEQGLGARLRLLRIRAARYALVRGCARVAAVACALGLFLCVIDSAWQGSRALRGALLALGLGLLIAAFWRWCLALVLRPISDIELAREVDAARPELRGAALCAIQLEQELERGALSSPELARAALLEIDARAGRCGGIEEVVGTSRFRAALIGALGMVALALTLSSLAPQCSGVAWSRALLLAERSYPTATRIASWTPADEATLRAGEEHVIEVHIAGERPLQGRARLQLSGGRELLLDLAEAQDGSWSAPLPALAELTEHSTALGGLRMSVEIGDAQSPWRELALACRPELQVRLEIEEARGITRSLPLGSYLLPEGTPFRLVANSSEELLSASLEQAGDHQGELPALSVSGKSIAGAWAHTSAGLRWRVRAIGVNGLESAPSPWLRISVQPDLAPRATWTMHAGRSSMLRDARLDLSWRAEDDLGLASVELSVSRENGTRTSVVQAQQPVGRTASGSFSVKLGDLELSIGELIELRIIARDSRSLGAREGQSPALSILIVDEAGLLARLAGELESLAREGIALTLELARHNLIGAVELRGAGTASRAAIEDLNARHADLERGLRALLTGEHARLSAWVAANGAQDWPRALALAASGTHLARSLEYIADAGLHAANLNARTVNTSEILTSYVESLRSAAGELEEALRDAAPRVLLEALWRELAALLAEQEGVQLEGMLEHRARLAAFGRGAAGGRTSMAELAAAQAAVLVTWERFHASLTAEAERADGQQAAREATQVATELNIAASMQRALDWLHLDWSPGRAVAIVEAQEEARSSLLKLLDALTGEAAARRALAQRFARQLSRLQRRAAGKAGAQPLDAEGAMELEEQLRQIREALEHFDPELGELLADAEEDAQAVRDALAAGKQDLAEARRDRMADDLEEAINAEEGEGGDMQAAEALAQAAQDLEDAQRAGEEGEQLAESVERAADELEETDPESADELREMLTKKRDEKDAAQQVAKDIGKKAAELRRRAQEQAEFASRDLDKLQDRLTTAQAEQEELGEEAGRAQSDSEQQSFSEKQEAEEERMEKMDGQQGSGSGAQDMDDAKAAMARAREASDRGDQGEAQRQHEMAAESLAAAREALEREREEAQEFMQEQDAAMADWEGEKPGKGGESDGSGRGLGSEGGVAGGFKEGSGEGSGDAINAGVEVGDPTALSPQIQLRDAKGAAWNPELPPLLRTLLEAGRNLEPPPGYERRFRRYFEVFP